MSYIPDNLDKWLEYDREQERQLEELPLCDECGEPIQEDFCYEINGDYICEHCMEGHKKRTGDLV